MGRNPWKSQQQTFTRATVEDAHTRVGGDYGRAFIRVVERIRGVDSKYNEQDGVASNPRRNSIQTTLPADSPQKIEYYKRDRTGKEMNKHTLE